MTPRGVCRALARFFEGCFLKAYLCPARVWTVGWGATGRDITQGTTWTKEQADARLEEDLTVHLTAASTLCPMVKGEKLGAVADFSFNLGATRLAGSTLRRKLNAGDFEGAAAEIRKWVYAGGKKLPGLIARREAEARWLQG